MNHKEFNDNLFNNKKKTNETNPNKNFTKSLKNKYELGKEYFDETNMGGMKTRKLVELGEEIVTNNPEKTKKSKTNFK